VLGEGDRVGIRVEEGRLKETDGVGYEGVGVPPQDSELQHNVAEGVNGFGDVYGPRPRHDDREDGEERGNSHCIADCGLRIADCGLRGALDEIRY
jgi:hypothetical protein